MTFRGIKIWRFSNTKTMYLRSFLLLFFFFFFFLGGGAVSQCNGFPIFVGFTLKGKNMLLRSGFLAVETYSTIQKLCYIDTDTYILRKCVHFILLIVYKVG